MEIACEPATFCFHDGFLERPDMQQAAAPSIISFLADPPLFFRSQGETYPFWSDIARMRLDIDPNVAIPSDCASYASAAVR